MAYDRDVFIDKLYEREVKKKQLVEITKAMNAEVEELSVTYNVGRLAADRSVIINGKQAERKALSDEIKAIEDSLVV